MVKKKNRKPKKNYFRNSGAKRRARIKAPTGHLLRVATLFNIVARMSCTFIFGYDLLTQWSFFSATDIRVSGFSRLSRQEILDHVDVHPGRNIFSINLATTHKRRRAHPWSK